MRAVLLVLASAVCFGTTGTAQAYGPDAASSSAVGLTRIVAGGALLGLVAWWVAGRRTAAPRTVLAPSARPALLNVLVGGAAVLAYQPTFFAGARLNGVAIGAVVTLGAAPVMTGLLEWLVTRRVPPVAWFAGTACAVAGVVLLSGLLEGAGQDVSARGLAGSLGAALSYAVYTIAAKRLLDTGWTPTAAVGSVFATAALLGAPFLLLVDLDWLASRSGPAMVLWLAVVTVVVAYVLFAHGLRTLSASTVSTLTLVEPMTACVLGLVLLDERLSSVGWAGLAVLLAGVVVLARPARGAEVVA
ncbi:DMT family transporter [Aeromicrobium stalagmiti]|uniref:DMT family transporter n=1 Tax=Aeromicrobium stalagmiti TaxID=2738988 RepID=UPI0015694835|nr:EamA family transporter [Aeromicrobium stalagmiti]